MNTSEIKRRIGAFRRYLHRRNPTRSMQVVVCSHRNRYMYYNIPKAACTTIRTCLARLEAIDLKGQSVHQSNAEVRLTLKQSAAACYRNYYRFTLVRNPWDRLYSCYKNKVYDPPRFFPKSNPYYNEKGEFNDFIKRYGDIGFKDMQFADFVHFVVAVPDYLCDPHFLPQHYFFKMDTLDFLGRFENFQSDLAWVMQKISPSFDGSEIITQKLQSSSASHYKDAYNDPLITLVADKYQKDIELFDYTF